MSPTELHLVRAAYVRALLAWHGKRQSDLAGIIGSSQQNASQKLAGKRRFTTDDLLAIAEALDVDPKYLLTVPRYDRGLLTSTYRHSPWSEPVSKRLPNLQVVVQPVDRKAA